MFEVGIPRLRRRDEQLLAAFLLFSPWPTLAQPAQADLILIHGEVLSVDANDTVAQAIAIRHGLILKVGSDPEVQALAAPNARVIDLAGHTATPGLIDTHAHVADGGVDDVFGIKLSDAISVAEIKARVDTKVRRVKPGDWITGGGWDEGKLIEHRYPTAADLDAVAPDNPVWLMHTTGHYGVANSLAMKRAGITAATRDPPAGTIDRDVQGKPTGVFKEDAAMTLITRLIPETTAAEMRAGILYIQDVLHSEGMTAVKDPDIFQIHWDAYKALLATGELKERICVLWDAGTTMASARHALDEINSVPRLPGSSLGDSRLLSCGVKLFMDGSGGARTGWMWQPWLRNGKSADLTQAGKPNTGYPHMNPDTYRKMVLLFQKAGVPVGTHAVGDRAMDWVVDTYASAEKQFPRPGLRHSIIHANLPTSHALDTMAALQSNFDAGYPEMQAEFLWWIGTIYADNYGPERDSRLIPLKTLQQRGLLWSGGSDYSVTPIPARYGLWASVARQTSAGLTPFGSAESVDSHTALRSYTAWGARQMFLENEIGTLEPGKRADIAVWDRNVYTIPTAEIKEMKCLMTLLDGEVVYRSADFPGGRPE
jgi:predicted amidohydrolase YtcJ